MILLVDAGNTRIKWRIIDAAAAPGWVEEGAVGHEDIESLRDLSRRHAGLARAVGANVAGDAVADRIQAALGGLALRWLVSTAACCGVRNGYDDPARLGSDRWAALIGARRLHPQACLIVTAGTATTVDLLDASGRFLGGLILPGVALMKQSLATRTAQLPLAEGRFTSTPHNTLDAIHSGCLQAQAGAVERMFRQIAAEPGALCLLGGGAADGFADLLQIPLRRVDNLVLLGLAAVAAED